MMNKSIALIGSRKAPNHILNMAKNIGKYLSDKGYIGNSGNAIGLDKAFMENYNINLSQVFIIERRNNTEPHFIVWDELDNQTKIKTYIHAKSVCPDFDNRPLTHQKLFARNICQVLGKDCFHPVEKVLYWAPEVRGIVKGGTRIAVNFARKLNIPTLNILDSDILKTKFMPRDGNLNIFDN